MSERQVLPMVGKRFGTFVVRERAEATTKSQGAFWRLECDCGESRVLKGTHLRHGHVPRCKHPSWENLPKSETTEAMEKILARVERISAIHRDVLTSRSRITLHSAARSVVCRMMRDAGFSFPEIGRALGRNHTSVLRACNQTLDELLSKLAVALGRREVESMRALVSAWREEIVEVVVEEPPTDAWQAALAKLRSARESERGALWKATCMAMFPHSWERQYTTPPRGLGIGTG